MTHRKGANVNYPNMYASEEVAAKNPAAFVRPLTPHLMEDRLIRLEVELCSASPPEHFGECWTDHDPYSLPWYLFSLLYAMRR